MSPLPAFRPPEFKHFDFAGLGAADRYKLVTAVVVPRPIAWVSTLGAGGQVNLAPYSFFGLMGSDPAVVAFAPGNRPDGMGLIPWARRRAPIREPAP